MSRRSGARPYDLLLSSIPTPTLPLRSGWCARPISSDGFSRESRARSCHLLPPQFPPSPLRQVLLLFLSSADLVPAELLPTSINGVSRKSVTLFNARPPFGPSPRVISLLNEQQNHAEYDAWVDRKLNNFSAEITRHAVALAGSYCLPRALVSKLAGRV